jgi:hydrogenase maturation protease
VEEITLILGLGNTLLRDEGVGVHAINRLAGMFEDDERVQCLDGGTLSFTLAGPIEEAQRLIVIDAAELHAEPGEVRLFENEALDEFLGANRKLSVHEVSLMDLMIIARLTDRLPSYRALVAVQPASVDWGEEPTPQVEAAIARVCEIVQGLVSRTGHE